MEFESTEDAKEALDTLNNTEIEGRSIRLEFSQKQKQDFGGGRGGSGKFEVNAVLHVNCGIQDCQVKDEKNVLLMMNAVPSMMITRDLILKHVMSPFKLF